MSPMGSGLLSALLLLYHVSETDAQCGVTSYAGSTGFITSPRFPLSYSNGLNCSYSLQVGRRNTAVLHFLSFDLESAGYASSCYHDWLTISCLSEESTVIANPSSVGKICGTVTDVGTVRFSNCDKLSLNFVTDSSVTNGGFRIQYLITERDEDCGNTSFTGPTGIVSSPRFPLSHPHGLNCVYSVDVGRSGKITLQFLSFDLEGTSYVYSAENCPYDWLTITCSPGLSTSANRTYMYCGQNILPLKLSFSNCSVLTLNFVTDMFVSHGGFQIQYKVIPPLDLFCGVSAYSLPSGVISPPWNYTDYGNNIDCKYTINATVASSISFRVWSISLQRSNGRKCQRDWLLISCVNGQPELDHKVYHRSCNYLNSNTQLTFPNCTAVQLVYHGESGVTGKTFRIQYTVNGYGTIKTELPTTAAETSLRTPTTQFNCATGCEMSSDATFCQCFTTHSSTFEPDTTTVTSVVPTTVSTISSVIPSTAIAFTSDLHITVRETSDASKSDTTTFASEVPATEYKSDASQPDTTTFASEVPATEYKSFASQPDTTTFASEVLVTEYITSDTSQPETTSEVPVTEYTSHTEVTTFASEVPVTEHITSDNSIPHTPTFAFEGSVTEHITSDARQRNTTTFASKVLVKVPTTSIILSEMPVIEHITSDASNSDVTTEASEVPTSRTSKAIQQDTTTFSSDALASQAINCDFRCTDLDADDRSNCRCSFTQSDEVVANTQMSHAAHRRYSFLIPVAVFTIVAIGIVLVILWVRRRFRKQQGQEILLEEMDDAAAADDASEKDSPHRESLFGARRNQKRPYSSRYLQLKQISLIDNDESSSNSKQNLNEIL